MGVLFPSTIKSHGGAIELNRHYAVERAGKKAGMLNTVRNCLTWYPGYFARICCSTVFASPL